MASATKLGSAKVECERPALARIAAVPARQAVASIDPRLKAFIDNVVIPNLVKEYLAELRDKNPLAANPSTVPQRSTNSTATAEGIR